MRDTWRTILDVALAGQAPKVSLPEAAFVPKPKRRGGRPRIRGATMFGHYDGYREDKGGRPRCAMCPVYLKKDQKLGCCEEHEKRAIAEARAQLQKVGAL